MAVNWESLTDDERQFVENLAHASVFDVVKSHDIQSYIEKGILSNKDDVDKRVDDASLFLTHRCNNICLVQNADGTWRCRMPKYINMTYDNTKQCFVELPINLSDECWNRLNQIG